MIASLDLALTLPFPVLLSLSALNLAKMGTAQDVQRESFAESYSVAQAPATTSSAHSLGQYSRFGKIFVFIADGIPCSKIRIYTRRDVSFYLEYDPSLEYQSDPV
ncbi:hypothetical protein GYMLUDRAFT_999432 [Collybiopsis luxurians FD-317 M1]|uniref:Uncharacterized protein n=1 Tax=Collybiopsis luxurians FD-317 M1 TaxID=944289 RepID=A0A0D0CD26_9AGAR|nr:hypothetical protein GYMLUDRAFT_999432 [Collybiopsis luxurians FD-317 M1]